MSIFGLFYKPFFLVSKSISTDELSDSEMPKVYSEINVNKHYNIWTAEGEQNHMLTFQDSLFTCLLTSISETSDIFSSRHRVVTDGTFDMELMSDQTSSFWLLAVVCKGQECYFLAKASISVTSTVYISKFLPTQFFMSATCGTDNPLQEPREHLSNNLATCLYLISIRRKFQRFLITGVCKTSWIPPYWSHLSAQDWLAHIFLSRRIMQCTWNYLLGVLSLNKFWKVGMTLWSLEKSDEFQLHTGINR